MAVSESKDGNSAMADEELPDNEEGADEAPKAKSAAKAETARKADAVSQPFFTIYKKGQGYWTRVGTVIGVGIVGLFTAVNLFTYLPAMLPQSVAERTAKSISMGVALGFAAVYSFIAWRLMNKPTNVEFLISTDSEMKKVNWTSRRELIGSTKVVVGFMFLTALFLFICDNIFILLMKAIGVLKAG